MSNIIHTNIEFAYIFFLAPTGAPSSVPTTSTPTTPPTWKPTTKTLPPSIHPTYNDTLAKNLFGVTENAGDRFLLGLAIGSLLACCLCCIPWLWYCYKRDEDEFFSLNEGFLAKGVTYFQDIFFSFHSELSHFYLSSVLTIFYLRN